MYVCKFKKIKYQGRSIYLNSISRIFSWERANPDVYSYVIKEPNCRFQLQRILILPNRTINSALKSGLHQVQRLEEDRGECPGERARQEGL